MALKSILEIDVQDDAFKEFQKLFAQYQEAVVGMPGAWNQIANSTDEAAASLDTLTKKSGGLNAAANARAMAQGRAAEAQRREDNEARTRLIRMQKGADSLSETGSRAALNWRSIAGDAKKVYGHVDDTTKSLAKWALMKGALGGLLGVGGSLYGLDRLASSAAYGRRQSMSSGVPFGDRNAFKTDFGRFVDPDGMIANVATAKTDATSDQYRGLLGSGLSAGQIRNQNAADLSVSLLHELPKLFPKGADDPLLGTTAEARGLTSVISPDEIKAYLRASPQERADQDKAYAADKRGMAVDGGTLKAWTDLNTQLTRAGSEIEKAFVTGLAPLAPEFGDLSKSAVALVGDFLKSKEIKEDLDGLATGLGNLDKALHDPSSWWNRAGSALDTFAKKEREAGDATHSWLMNSAPWLNPANLDTYAGGSIGTHHAAKRGRWLADIPEAEHDRASGKLRAMGGHPVAAAAPSDGYSSSGPVPGASGYGSIDAYWKGSLGSPGEGGKLSPSGQFAYLKSIGADDNEALLLTGAAASESSFNPNAVHDNGTGHGLFGHKDDRLNMQGKNWQEQDQAALAELRKRPEHALLERAKTPQDVANAEMYYERPRGFSTNNPRGGDNYTGRLHSIERFAQAFTKKATDAERGTIGDRAAFEAEQRRTAGQVKAGDEALIAAYKQQQASPAAKATASLSHPQSHAWAKLNEGRTKDDRIELGEASLGKPQTYGHPAFDARARGAVQARNHAVSDRIFSDDDLAALKAARGARPAGDDQGSSLDRAKNHSSGLGFDKLHRKSGHDISIYNASGADVSASAGPASYG